VAEEEVILVAAHVTTVGGVGVVGVVVVVVVVGAGEDTVNLVPSLG
jgi:hypothetical protein